MLFSSSLLSHAPRLLSSGYKPTDADVLRCRRVTLGIVETHLILDGTPFTFLDVGGQRGQRSKWIAAFEDVAAILWVASLSEYDQVLAEDPRRNRLVESLALFEAIIHLPWFAKTPIILFLNKYDLYLTKMKCIDLRSACGDLTQSYEGGSDPEAGLAFIKGLFRKRHHRKHGMPLYVHITTATNTENVRCIWNATKDIVLRRNLREFGLL